jgi:hypothetical protein
MNTYLTTAVGILTLMLGSSISSAQEFWRLPTDQARCLMENINAYVGSGAEIVMIVAAGCPEPDPGKALVTVTRNSAVPSLQALPDGAEVDSIIVYRARELACLGQVNIDMSRQIALLPKEPQC